MNFEYYHNRNSWKDIFELEIQARLSDEAIKLSGGNMTKYYTELGRIYKEKIGTGRVDQIYGTTQQLYNITKNLLLDNQKVIFVTHSQANFFIEAVYSMLSNDALTDPRAGEMLKNFRIVGAGVVAYSSPNGRYISSTSDKALMGMVADNEPINLYFKVLERKYTPCLSDVCGVSIPWLQYGDLSAHGFGETYLSNVLVDKISQKTFSSIVAGMIKASFDELNPLTPTTPPLNGYWLTKCFDDDQNGIYFQQLMDVSLINDKIHIAQKVRRNYGADSTCKGVFSTEPASSETLSDVLVSTNIQGGDTIYTFKNPDGSTYTVTVNTATLTLSDDPIASPFTRQPSFAFPTQSTLNWKTNPANNHLYTVLSCGNWTQCETKAIELGGHLVTVNDAAENKWLVDTYSTNPNLVQGPWIGLSDADNEGIWKWVSEENISYSNWYSGEPNNSFGRSPEGEDYGHILLQTGNWNDIANFSDYGGVNQTSWAIIEKLN